MRDNSSFRRGEPEAKITDLSVEIIECRYVKIDAQQYN